MRASSRTSRFWSSRSWNNSGIAADLSCWTSSHPDRSAARGGSRTGGSRASCGRWRAATSRRRANRIPGGRKLQAFLDAGDLDVAEQGVVLLHRRLWRRLRLRRRWRSGRCWAHRCRWGRSTHRPGAATGSGPASLRRCERGGRERDDRELVLLVGLVGDRGFGCRGGGQFEAIAEPGRRDAVAAQNGCRGGADHQNAGQRDDRRWLASNSSPLRAKAHLSPKTGN